MVILGHILLAMVMLYATAGVAMGLRFASVLAAQSDDRAAVGTFSFRLLLIPGAALLWPLVLWRQRAGKQDPLPHPTLPESDRGSAELES